MGFPFVNMGGRELTWPHGTRAVGTSSANAVQMCSEHYTFTYFFRAVTDITGSHSTLGTGWTIVYGGGEATGFDCRKQTCSCDRCSLQGILLQVLAIPIPVVKHKKRGSYWLKVPAETLKLL